MEAGTPPEEWIPLRDAGFYAEQRIDVLLGTDLLRECVFDIDWPLRQVTFAGPSNGVGHAVPLTTRLGLPIATAEFGGESLQFVVDTTGAVEPCTMSAGESSDTRFIQAAVDMVRWSRFTPGRKDGKKVRALVRQGITFE